SLFFSSRRRHTRSKRDWSSDVCSSDLWFGARKSVRPEATRREIDAFLKPFEVLPFDHEAADEYARLRFELERIGRPIGERDLLKIGRASCRERAQRAGLASGRRGCMTL